MDDVRIGNTLRAIRVHKRLRQSDVARRAGVQRELVSRLERGGLGRTRHDALRSIATALGARVDVRLRWQGGDLDRVLNAQHAAMHEAVARHLSTMPGWTWKPEVSFSIYGERGVIDILAWHAETRSLLVIELKTEVVDPQDLVATMDRRVRLGPRIAQRLGWTPASVNAWVIFADTRTNHRRVLRHAGLLRAAFPADGHSMRSWLRNPGGHVSALSFWTGVATGATGPASGQPRRVRRTATGALEQDSRSAGGRGMASGPRRGPNRARESG